MGGTTGLAGSLVLGFLMRVSELSSLQLVSDVTKIGSSRASSCEESIDVGGRARRPLPHCGMALETPRSVEQNRPVRQT